MINIRCCHLEVFRSWHLAALISHLQIPAGSMCELRLYVHLTYRGVLCLLYMPGYIMPAPFSKFAPRTIGGAHGVCTWAPRISCSS